MDLNAEKTCSICGCTYTGWGNNAYPVTEERCCDDCNRHYVIPARIYGIKNPDDAKRYGFIPYKGELC